MSFIEAMKEAAIEVAISVIFLAALCAAVVMLYYIIVLVYRIITGQYHSPKNQPQKDNRKYVDYQNTLNNFFINRINEDIENMPEIYTPASDQLIALYNDEQSNNQ